MATQALAVKRRLQVLLLAAVLVAGYYFLVERPDWEGEKANEEDERVVLDFEPDRMIGVEVYRGGDVVELRRDDAAQWWIRSPIDYPVKQGAVKTFLAGLLEATRYYEVAETLEPEREEGFGLDEATAALLTLFDREGFQLHLRIGKATPTGDAYYFQRGGDPAVHLGSDQLSAIRLLNYQTLRDPTLFAVAMDDILELDIATPAQAFTLRKDGKGLWRVVDAIEDVAAGSKIKQWVLRDALYELSNARVRSYRLDGVSPEQFAVYGLGKGARLLRFKSADGESGLALGNEAEESSEVFARRLGEDTLFSMSSTLVDFVDTPLGDLLDPSPIDADFSQLVGLEALWPDGLELRSVGTGYEQETVIDGSQRDELSIVTQNVFYGLSRPDIVGRIGLTGDRGLEQLLAGRPVVFTLRFASESIRVEVGEGQERGSYWLRVEGDSTAYQIDRGIYLRFLGWRQAVESLG